MGRLYDNFVDGVTSSDLTISGTTLSSSGLADLLAVSGADYVYVTLDADSSAGEPEVVKVTAHVGAATTATIVRAQLGTTAREHLAGTDWVAGVYDSDFQRVDTVDSQIAALQATDTSLDGRLDAIEAASWVTETRLQDAAVTSSKLAANSVATAKVQDSAITTVKIADSNVTTAKLPDGAVTGPKIPDGAISAAHMANARVVQASMTSTSHTGGGSIAQMAWTSASVDPHGFFGAFPDNTLTVPASVPGLYTLEVIATPDDLAAFSLRIEVGGRTLNGEAVSNSSASYSLVWMGRLSASDTISVRIVNTGVTRNFTGALSLSRLGPLT